MKNIILAIAAILSLSAFTDTKTTTYKVNVAKSTCQWTGKKVTGTHWGYVKISDGVIAIEKGIVKSGTLNVDMNTIDAQDIKGEYAGKLIGHLKSDDFFGVTKFPKASLVIKSVSLKNKITNTYEVKANLTVKGTTQEISFPATIVTDKTSVKADAELSIDRTKYGIKYGSGSFFDNLGDKAINNDFVLKVHVEAGK